MSFQAPLFLLLLVPVGGLAVLLARTLPGEGSRRRTLLFAVRCVSLALLVAALAQPAWGSTTTSPVIFVVDRSASINPAMRAGEDAWLHHALNALPAGTARWLVTFAGAPSLDAVPAHPASLTVRPASDTGQTNIQDGIRLALGSAPAASRLVLLTDGLQTQGDLLATGAGARAHHIPIDVVVPIGRPEPDAAVTRLQVAPAIHQGDPVPLLFTVRSTVSRPAVVSLAQDGRLLGQQTVALQSGDNPYLITIRTPNQLGWHVYRVAVAMKGDVLPGNDALNVTTRVVTRPQLLLVSSSRADSFAALLRQLGITAEVRTPNAFPSSAASLRGLDGVVLDNVPAAALSARQVAALDDAVRVEGLGLLLLGGPQSLTLGHYSQTPLERILPVNSVPPSSLRQGGVALQLVLDRSGSMNNLAGSEPKILMAQAAANIAVDFALAHKDDLGVVSFDYYSHILVPLQKVASADTALRIHHTINRLTADGGTNIYAALKDGLNQVIKSNAPYRHIILMTDGVSDPANYDTLLRQFPRWHITLSTVAMGTDADTRLLQYLAKVGKGRYYFTNNASDLPRIFAKEIRLSAGDIKVAGTIPVGVGSSSPILRDLAPDHLLPVRGYPATSLKPGAVSLLAARAQGRGGDPILAQWQYGLGRVLVWTPGSGAWSGAWMNARSNLWDDAVRWVLRGVVPPLLEPRLQSAGAAPQLVIDTLQNAGAPVNLAYLDGLVQTPGKRRYEIGFQQTGPGTYQAPLPGGQSGVYRLTIRQLDVPQNQTAAAVAVPYPQEYAPAPPAIGLLGQLAAETGGRILSSPRQLQTGTSSALELWWPLAALALALFLIEVLVRLLGLGIRNAATEEGSEATLRA